MTLPELKTWSVIFYTQGFRSKTDIVGWLEKTASSIGWFPDLTSALFSIIDFQLKLC